MVARSCINLLDLVPREVLNFPQTHRALRRVMTVPRTFSDVDGKRRDDDDDDDEAEDYSNTFSSECNQKIIIVANFLPINAEKDKKTGRWCFTYDEGSILWQLKDSISSETDVFYVGSLKADEDASEQGCWRSSIKQFYNGFCKQHLWPIFHDMLPMHADFRNGFDRSLWQAYVSANKIFADKVMEVINPEQDYVWVHNYHLMVLPTFLRRRCNKIKLGYFLHSPFPSSEINRTLPVRDEILKALLNSDLIGFHTFDYARHFLSCCSRILGLKSESKRGYIELEYFGRIICIKSLLVGIHVGWLQSALDHSSSLVKAREIYKKFKGKKLVLGVDDMDIFKGISLKLLAMEELLQQYPEFQGEFVLVQIVKEAQKETYITANRINKRFGFAGYQPVIIIDHPIPVYEKISYVALADCCVVNAVRDGMNLIPYEYVVCRQGSSKMDEALELDPDSPHTSALVVSEFMDCSPSLGSAIRVNPWDINGVANAMNLAIKMPSGEQQLRHNKHYRYVKSHDLAYWSRSFMRHLEHSCKDHFRNRCWGMGFGLSFRVLSLSPSFRKVSNYNIVSAYRRTSCRMGSRINLGNESYCTPRHYRNADPDFGSWQAKQLLDHLDGVLANEPVVVKKGKHIIEVMPQGITKGLVAEEVLSSMAENGKSPDFVLCVGDDRSDEDMFESLLTKAYGGTSLPAPEIFSCTVGQKPSKAKYYLDDTVDVMRLLQALGAS
ncbi:hypothetical protein HN51_001869 [Arachis hypogaea]